MPTLVSTDAYTLTDDAGATLAEGLSLIALYRAVGDYRLQNPSGSVHIYTASGNEMMGNTTVDGILDIFAGVIKMYAEGFDRDMERGRAKIAAAKIALDDAQQEYNDAAITGAAYRAALQPRVTV